MSEPKVSVILPVYNGEEFLQSCLDSVMAQDYKNYELIVIDDGSSDSSGEIARNQLEVRYFYQENRGVAAARNLGIEQADGGYLAFIDADDLWHPNKLSTQIEFMENHPGIGYTFTKHQIFLHEGMEKYPHWVREDAGNQATTGYIPSSLVVRRNVFHQVGYFDPAFSVSEDSDWFLRARDSSIPMAVVEDVLLYKRIHDHNLSSQTDLIHHFLLRAMKASLQRKRANIKDME